MRDRANEENTRAALTVKSRRMTLVLKMFNEEQLSTFCIAQRLEIDEREVCALLEEVRAV